VRSFDYNARELRVINAVVVAIILPYQVRRLLQLRWSQPAQDGVGGTGDKTKDEEDVDELTGADINHTIFNICLFPPLFFFSALYYTDVLSASCVLEAYIAYLQRRQTVNTPPKARPPSDGSSSLQTYFKEVSYVRKIWPSDITLLGFGLFALLFRQTNIFWVAIYLAGLEVIRNLKHNRTTSWNDDITSFAGIVGGSWHRRKIYDPLVREACIEGSKLLNLIYMDVSKQPS